jgi:hypothetical protein
VLLAVLVAAGVAGGEALPVARVQLGVHGAAGEPVVARVEVASAGEEPPVRLEATAPGSLELPLAGVAPWTVRVEAEGLWSAPLLVEAPPEATLRVDLWPETRLRARLRPPRGHALPESVGLRLQPAGAAGRGRTGFGGATLLCPVDEGGRLDCRGPRLADVDVRLRAPGFASRFFWGLDLSASASHDLGAVELRPGASVVGRVEVPTGFEIGAVVARLVPIPGVAPRDGGDRVERQAGEETIPDARGFFAFEGLAAGSYRLEVGHPALASAELAPVRVIDGGQTEVAGTIGLAEPVPLRLLFDPPFDPYGEDWRVELLRHIGAGQRSRVLADRTLLATAGFLEAATAAAAYEVRVLDSRGAPVATAEVAHEEGSGPHLVEVRPVLVDGLVTLGDEPLLAGVTFRGPATFEMDSDLAGRFRGYLPRVGEWDVEVRASEPPVRRRMRAVEVELEDGGSRAVLHLRVPDTRLRGTVVDERGAPVAGADVTATDPLHSSREVTVTTGGDGEFEIHGLDAGTVQAQAELRREGREEASSAPEIVDLREGGTPELRLVLRPHAGLRGRLVAADGNPVPGAWIEAQPFNAAGVVDAPFAQPRSTDAAGRFDVSLPRSTAVVHLVALAPGHPLTQRAVEVGDLGDVVLGGAAGDLVVEMPGLVADVPWSDPTALRPGLVAPAGKLPLMLLGQWAGANGTVWRPEDTRVTVPLLAPGTYGVCWFSARDWMLRSANGSSCATGVLAAGGTLTLRLPPSPGADRNRSAAVNAPPP